jgi:hypothetical protein
VSAEQWRIDRADLGPGHDAVVIDDTGEMPVVIVPPGEGGAAVADIREQRRRWLRRRR